MRERPDTSALAVHLVQVAVEADVAPPLQLVEVERITAGGGCGSQVPIRQANSRRAVSRHAVQPGKAVRVARGVDDRGRAARTHEAIEPWTAHGESLTRQAD